MNEEQKMKNKKGTAYSDKEKQFIRAHWQDMTDAELGDAIGRPAGGITAQRHKMGFTNYSRNKWTDDEEQIVKDHYAHRSNEDILAMLPRHRLHALYHKAHALGLNKSAAFLARQRQRLGKALAQSEVAKANQFEKGHQPFNKGKKQEEFMSREAIEKSKKTRFKKGHQPANTKWDGAISLRHDSGTGRPYLWIRLSMANWQMYQVHLWEKENGPVPDGHIIVFGDGNSMNISPDNLECISRAEHVDRNRNWQKAMATMKREGTHASRNLTDPYVASMVAGHDDELKDYLLQHRPDIISAARANYRLQRKIKEATDG